jgi:hypothetical protein
MEARDSILPSSASTTTIITTSLRLEGATRALVDQLYNAWSSKAPLSTFASIRDEILASRGRIDVHILTLSAVAKVACPARTLAEDDRWTTFFALASACANDVDAGDEPARPRENRVKRKRTDNAAARVRNLAVVAALWSPTVRTAMSKRFSSL